MILKRTISSNSKAILYARVSSREQAEGYSIDAQLKLLREYCRKNNLEIITEYIDIETAKKVGRPRFDEMVKYFESHSSVKNLLVEKTDRLYRNFGDYVTLDHLKLEVHLVKEGTLLSQDSTSHEKFIHGIKVLMAKNYIDNLREEVIKGMLGKAAKGIPPTRAPIGYKNNPVTRDVDVDPIQAPWVKKMFEWYATGQYSLEKLTRQLFGAGFTYQPSRPKMTATTLEKILKNPFYIGRFKFSGEIFEGKYSRFISTDLFNLVQASFTEKNHGRQQKHNFVYSGLLTCGDCGCSITAEIKKRKYVYYHCTHRKNPCSQTQSIREEELDLQFQEIVRNISIGPEVVEWIKAALKASSIEAKQFQSETLQGLNRQVELLEKRLEKAFVAKLDGEVSEELWQKKSGEWRRELEENREKIHNLSKATSLFYEQGIAMLELAERAYLLYQKQDQGQRRALLQILCSNSILRDGVITPKYRQPFDLLAVGKKQISLNAIENKNKTKVLEKWWRLGESNS